MASSNSQIDKPQRGRPKRAELPVVNINTSAQSINTESLFNITYWNYSGIRIDGIVPNKCALRINSGHLVSTAPDEPPQNVSAQALSSTSMHVQWRPVSRNHRNGIIRGYRLVYSYSHTTDTNKRRSAAKQQWTTYSVVYDASTMERVLPGLEKFTHYCIQLLAFTNKGDGPLSPCVACMTLEDGEL